MKGEIKKQMKIQISEIPELFSQSKGLITGGTLSLNELSDQTAMLYLFMFEQNQMRSFRLCSDSMQVLYDMVGEYLEHIKQGQEVNNEKHI